MNEFKTGDKVELIESVAGFGVGTIGIVKEVLKDTFWNHLKVELKSGPILTSHIKCFKKVGEVRPNLKNRDECLERIYGKQPKSNVEKVFDMLGVKPNEPFKLNAFKNALYKINEDLVVLVQDEKRYGWHVSIDTTIEPILNGAVEITKIKKYLLTDSEKGFLRCFKFDSLKIVSPELWLCHDNLWQHRFNLAYCKHKFPGLERNKEYTAKELGL